MNGAMFPAVIEKHFDGLQFWEDGKLVLASSNLTGRYWNGTLFCFKNYEDVPDTEKCLTGHETESGIGDVCCLKGNKVAIGMDSGAVQLYEFYVKTPVFVSLGYGCEHDNLVSSIGVNCDESLLISCSYDKSIKVWDLQVFTSIATYRPVHSGIVWQVSCSTTDPQMLLSCGNDKNVFLMDLRLPKPAMLLCTNKLKSCPTAVAWKPMSDCEFAVGDDSGHIIIQDIRNSLPSVEYDAHNRRIHRMAFSPNKHSLLASCADSTDVFVKDIDNPSSDFQDDIHNDFVRGLAWNPQNELITCGWDKQVLRHEVSHLSSGNVSPDK